MTRSRAAPGASPPPRRSGSPLRLRNRYANWRHGFACRRAVELATDFLEGALSERDAALYERHLSRCPACQSYLDQMRLTIELSGRLRPGDLPRDVLVELVQLHRSYRRRAR